MSEELYACIYAPEFPAQALLRLRPDLKGEAVAVIEGRHPLEAVCSMNAQALRKGAIHGMTRVEAEAIAGLRQHPRSFDNEGSARAVLLECASHFSPRIEDASTGTVAIGVLDITGMERLFGAPEAIAQRLRAALKTSGFHAAVAVSANFHAARIKAAFTRGIAIIPHGKEAKAVAPLPLTFRQRLDDQ